MPTWTVSVTFSPFPDIMDDDDKIAALMEVTGNGLSHLAPLEAFTLMWEEDADTLDEVSRTAADTARKHLNLVGHGTEPIAHIEIKDYETPTEVDHLDKQTDIAFWLGVSRQRVAQLAKKDPAFPAVAMKLNDGTPLYRPMDVMRYAAARKEKLGQDA
jgi:hypothetical protein